MVWRKTIGNGPTKVIVIHGWFWDHRVFTPIFDCLFSPRVKAGSDGGAARPRLRHIPPPPCNRARPSRAVALGPRTRLASVECALSRRQGAPARTIDEEQLLLRALLHQTSAAGGRSFTERADRGKEGAIAAFPNRTRADIAHFSAWHQDAEMRISTRMRRQPRAPAMTFLRSVPFGLDYRALKPLRYGTLMRLCRRQAVRICAPAVGAIIFFARGLVAMLLRCGQAFEARRVRTHLLELDDHLLSDVGLTRADVRFGNIATVIRQSHRPAEPAHQSRGLCLVGEKR